MKSILTLLLALLGFNTIACDCEWQGNFIELCRLNDLIAIVEIEDYLTVENPSNGTSKYGVRAKVVQMIKGESISGEIIIWKGQNSCHESIDHLVKGEQHFILLSEYQHTEELKSYGWNFEKVYATDFCGEYSMKFVGDTVYSSPLATGNSSKKLFVNDYLQKIDRPISLVNTKK